MWNMFISKLGCLECRGNHLRTSQSRFKSPKINELSYVLEFKTNASPVLVSLLPG